MAQNMIGETVWFEQPRVESAETVYQEVVAKRHSGLEVVGTKLRPGSGKVLSSIEQARGLIGQALNAPVVSSQSDVEKRLSVLEEENKALKACMARLEARVCALEGTKPTAPSAGSKSKDNDDDFDLFGSDSEEEEVAVKPTPAVSASTKPKKVVIAKSNLILDVKPWDDETDMAELEANVRSVCADGLLWGASKILPVAYGIMKLQITCVIEDDKIGTDFLEESITAFEDLVQSVDIVAFNKI